MIISQSTFFYLTIINTGVILLVSIIASFALSYALKAYMKVVLLENATHTVQFMPAEAAKEGAESWAMTDKEVDEINKDIIEDQTIVF